MGKRGKNANFLEKKVSVYYKYSLLAKQNMSSKDNMQLNFYEGPIFSDKLCTNQIGTLLLEHIANITTNYTKMTTNLFFSNGTITYMLFNKLNNGKATKNSNLIGPVAYGTSRYLKWSPSHYSVNVFMGSDDDTRNINVYKSSTR